MTGSGSTRIRLGWFAEERASSSSENLTWQPIVRTDGWKQKVERSVLFARDRVANVCQFAVPIMRCDELLREP